MNHNWFAVIPAKVLLDKNLSDKQKLLIALISNLSTEKGYCFASNRYLGQCLGCAETTVRQNIADLEDKKYIGRIIKLNSKKEVEFRSLMVLVNDDVPLIENRGTPDENQSDPSDENQSHNNKVINNKEYKEDVVLKKTTVRQDIIKYWLEVLHPGWTFSGQTGKAIDSIISKIKTVQKGAGKESTDISVYQSFVLICENLPEWYKEKDLPVINSKFNEILTEIKNTKNGHHKNKQVSKYA